MRPRGWLVPVVVFVVTWGLTTHGKYSVSGDEPHYLIVAQSLVADGDIDLRNNHAAGDSRRFGVDALEPGPHARESRRGRELSVHDIGLPVALTPVYAVATAVSEVVSEPVLRRFRMSRGLFAYSLISLFLIGIAATAATLTWRALLSSGTSPATATVIVLAAWLSPPVLSNAFLVFPEIIALLVTAWVIRAEVSAGQATADLRRWVLVLAPLSLLPWFHRKYVVYVVAVTVVLAWRHRHEMARHTPVQRAAGIAGLALPTIVLLLWTWYHWGSVGGALTVDRSPFTWDAFRVGWVGMLVDRENGLLVWAPIYLLLPVAWMLARRQWIWLIPASSLYLVSAAHDQWWGGFSPAGRFLVPLVPIFCVVGASLVRSRLTALAALCLLMPQALISAYGWQNTRALWPQGDGQNRVVGALLRMAGAGDSFLPALRVDPEGVASGVVLLLAVVAANVAIWFACKPARGSALDIP